MEVTVTYRKQTRVVRGKPKQDLLGACHESGLDVAYSCRGGSCKQCLVKVEGEDLGAPTPRERFLLGHLYERGFRISCVARFPY